MISFFWSVELDLQKHRLDYVILCSQNVNLLFTGGEKPTRTAIKYFSSLSLAQISNSVSGNVMWLTICPVEQSIFSLHFYY